MASRMSLMAGIFACLALGAAGTARAEVTKHLTMCKGGLCGPHYRAVVSPPEGWAEDEAAGRRDGGVVLLPAGETEDTAGVQIFTQAALFRETIPFERAMRREIDLWRERDPTTHLTRIGPVRRRDGESFELHGFEDRNPEDRSVGRVAWGMDRDRDGNRYLVVVVLTAKGTRLDEAAERAYLAVLRNW